MIHVVHVETYLANALEITAPRGVAIGNHDPTENHEE